MIATTSRSSRDQDDPTYSPFRSAKKTLPIKTCGVQECSSKSTTHPDKLFFSMPTNLKRRSAWLKAIGRDSEKYFRTGPVFVCADHFNLEEDLENYVSYKYYAGGGKKHPVFKSHVVPHIFKCQKKRQAQTERYVRFAERRRKALVDELLKKSSPSSGIQIKIEDQIKAEEWNGRDNRKLTGIETKSEEQGELRIKTEDDIQNVVRMKTENGSHITGRIKTENEIQNAVSIETDDATKNKVEIKKECEIKTEYEIELPYYQQIEIDPLSVKQEIACDTNDLEMNTHEEAVRDPLKDGSDSSDDTKFSPSVKSRDIAIMATPLMVDFSVNCDLMDIPSDEEW